MNAQLGGTLGITIRDGALLVCLLLDECTRLLTIARHGRQVPRLCEVPFGLGLNGAGVVIDVLRLLVGLIVAGVPNAIAVAVGILSAVILSLGIGGEEFLEHGALVVGGHFNGFAVDLRIIRGEDHVGEFVGGGQVKH